MATEDRFKQSVVATLARRAANRCSNPDCGAITSGPTDAPDGAVNLGEAAHIYGANPGSARYDSSMASADRSAITNAVWLCGNCHKLVDDDSIKYPAGLLFEWQRAHERRIAEQLGKTAAEVRQRYETRHLEEFGRLSYLAERLILEKGDFWEYRLTAEVLRFEMAPVLQRWRALKRGLYIKQNIQLSREEFGPWMASRNVEIQAIAGAFDELANVEFKRAWGEPGVPGNEVDIVATCRIFTEMCQSALAWEESVRFVNVDEIFQEILSLYIGVAGTIIDEAAKIPLFLRETFDGNPTSGTYALHLELKLPDGWGDAVSKAADRAAKRMKSESQ